MSMIDLMASSNFLVINRALLVQLGANTALMLGELAGEHCYWRDQGELTEDGFFFSTRENIRNHTGLSDYLQRKALEALQADGLVEVRLQGSPPMRYIRLDEGAIERMVQGFQTSKNLNLKVQNFSTSNFKEFEGKNNNNNNNNSCCCYTLSEICAEVDKEVWMQWEKTLPQKVTETIAMRFEKLFRSAEGKADEPFLIREAFAATVQGERMTVSYLLGVLDNWISAGVWDADTLHADQEARAARKKPKKAMTRSGTWLPGRRKKKGSRLADEFEAMLHADGQNEKQEEDEK